MSAPEPTVCDDQVVADVGGVITDDVGVITGDITEALTACRGNQGAARGAG